MQILHVINQLSRAGAELSLEAVVLGTNDRSCRHGVAVLRADNDGLDRLAAAGVPTFVPRTTLESLPARVRHVYRAIRSFSPDLVHTTLFDADVAGRIAAKVSGVPALTSLVNTPYTSEALRDSGVHPAKLRAVRLIDRVLSRHATSAFHAITDTVAQAAVDSLDIDRSRITVVQRGRSRERLGWPSADRRRVTRAALGLPGEVPVLINVARQEAQKGHTYLLEAFAEVRARHPTAVLVLVGRQGNRSPAINQRIEELRLGDAVRMLGIRTDVADLLCAADAFIFPSLYEGLGGAVVEAMAMGVPIVASQAPALQEVLEGGRCGLLAPVADSRSLAMAIEAVLQDPAAAGERSRAALARFASTYELSICLDGMRRLYQGLDRPQASVPQ